MKIYLNGQLVDRDQATVSVYDHGLLYGDGVFEGIRAYRRLVFKLTAHVDRLFESAHTLMLKIPLSKAALQAAVIRTLKANRLSDAYIRVVVTRGPGDLGLDPRKCPTPTVFIITDRIALYPERIYREGMAIVTVPTQRNIPEALNPQIKSLNYLNNILAKIEATNAGVEEAIMLNPAGYVAECTGDNVFIVTGTPHGMALLTPPPYVGLLKGITRDTVMDLARRHRLSVREAVLTRHDLFNADECFLTGTAAEIVPVVRVDGRLIGTGRPGPITTRLRQAFRRLTRTDGIRY